MREYSSNFRPIKAPIEIIRTIRHDIASVNTSTGEEIKVATVYEVKILGLTVYRKIIATLVTEVRLFSIPVLCSRHKGWVIGLSR